MTAPSHSIHAYATTPSAHFLTQTAANIYDVRLAGLCGRRSEAITC